MFNEVRSSIIHKNCIDVDFKNSIVTIIIYLAIAIYASRCLISVSLFEGLTD